MCPDLAFTLGKVLPQTVQGNSAGDLGDCPGLLIFLILFAVTAFFRQIGEQIARPVAHLSV